MSDELATVRSAVIGSLKPLLPPRWDIKPGQTTPSTIQKPTLYVNYDSISPLPAAPLGHVEVGFLLTISDPLTDLAKSENAVDDEVVDLILALDEHLTIVWTSAKKIRAEGNDALSWQIQITTTASKQKED